MTLSDVLAKASELFKGEPARAIGYGAAVAAYFIARYSGAIDDLTLDQSIILTAGYVATIGGVIESIRSLVTPVAKG